MNHNKLMLLPIFFAVFSLQSFWSLSPKKKEMAQSVQSEQAVVAQEYAPRARAVMPNQEGMRAQGMMRTNGMREARQAQSMSQDQMLYHTGKELSEVNGGYAEFVGGPKHFILEANAGLYRPSSCVLREIYGKNWINYQVKVSGAVVPSSDSWKRLHLWFAINYTANSGLSINGLEYTKMQIVPISLGLRFIEPLETVHGKVELYAGVGLKYFFVDIRNKSEYVEPCVNKNTLGGVIDAGLYYLATEHVAFNLWFDYSFGEDRCSNKSNNLLNVRNYPLKLSGVSIGGGLGFRF